MTQTQTQTKPNTITVDARDLAGIIWRYGEDMANLAFWREAVAEKAIRVQHDNLDRSCLENAKRGYQYAAEDMKDTLDQMRKMGIKPQMEKWLQDLMA